MLSRPSSRGNRQLQPCIRELLRTRFCPPCLLLRVERVVAEAVEGTHRREANGTHTDKSQTVESKRLPKRAFRLLLSDGELMIQAALLRPLHALLDADDGLQLEGSLIELRKFSARKAKRLHGTGHVIFLAVEDFERVVAPAPPPASETPPSSTADPAEGGFLREDDDSTMQSPIEDHHVASRRAVRSQFAVIQVPSSPPSAPATTASTMVTQSLPSSQDSDGFETITVDVQTLKRRRGILRELHDDDNNLHEQVDSRLDDRHRNRRRPAPEPPSRGLSNDNTPVVHAGNALDRGPPAPSTAATVVAAPGLQIKQPCLLNTSSSAAGAAATTSMLPPPSMPPAPLHTLASLLWPAPALPTRNYRCSVFGVVTWVSATVLQPKPHSPFPAKRHIKMHDLSIARHPHHQHAGVTVAVFVDAARFRPRVGAVALLSDVVMHRWEGQVILNKYAGGAGGSRRNGGGGGVGDGANGDADGSHQQQQQPPPSPRWFESDETEEGAARLAQAGYDVEGLRAWWEERSRKGSSYR